MQNLIIIIYYNNNNDNNNNYENNILVNGDLKFKIFCLTYCCILYMLKINLFLQMKVVTQNFNC